tara:strand:- start:555 stop:845 length:291 start_codon:yes stop_codon:yes gene_type:complete
MTDICGICGDLLDSKNSNGEIIRTIKLKCNHVFHFECIQLSYKFNNNKECPYCRQNGGNLHIYPLCPAILKSGKNKGNPCNCKIKNNQIYCGKHLK